MRAGPREPLISESIWARVKKKIFSASSSVTDFFSRAGGWVRRKIERVKLKVAAMFTKMDPIREQFDAAKASLEESGADYTDAAAARATLEAFKANITEMKSAVVQAETAVSEKLMKEIAAAAQPAQPRVTPSPTPPSVSRPPSSVVRRGAS